MDFKEDSVCRSVRTSSSSGGSSSCNNQSRKKKRFSDEQIMSLEVMFGCECKPDPGIKQQLAAELGLQPTQVAIWFQNRRARLKPKQIEREYATLKASYDSLACKFESLKKNNLSLTAQVKTLIEKIERVRNCKMCSEQPINNAYESMGQTCVQVNMHKVGDQHHESNNGEHKFKVMEQQLIVDGSNNVIPLEMMNNTPFAVSSANSWSSEYCVFMDQSSCGSSQWWEF